MHTVIPFYYVKCIMKYFVGTVFKTDSSIRPSNSKEIPANNAACTKATWKPMQHQQTWNISVAVAGTNEHVQI